MSNFGSLALSTVASPASAENLYPRKSHKSYKSANREKIAEDGEEGSGESGYSDDIAAIDDDKHSYNLPLEVYEYYARIQREYEDKGDYEGLYEEQRRQLSDPHSNLSEDKIEAAQTLRKANFYSVFFLITTDILGPSNAPYAMSQLGYVPGIILYVGFGFFAMLGGVLLQRSFMRVDSNNYPVRTFADLAARILGRWSRYGLAGLQFIQMILNVGIIILSSGQALAQAIQSTPQDIKLCFSICVVIWAFVGMAMGQIRTLRGLSFVSNLAVWMNIAICIITMVGAATGPPNYQAAKAQYGINPGPVKTYAAKDTTLQDRLSGINQMVFAWGGATIFCEVMAEMRRPKDFHKGMFMADSLIMVVYLVFGIFVYAYQGSYVQTVANQGISQYGLQLAANILSLISGMFAAGLYGNVGLKVLYQGFLVPEFKFPHLGTKKGILVWGGLVIIYWAVAFVIGAAIPQVNNLSGLVGSLCILNFSYVFPAVFMTALMMQSDASVYDKFDPTTGVVERLDPWFTHYVVPNMTRWGRAMWGTKWRALAKLLMTLIAMGGLCLSGMGIYSAVEGMITSYATAQATSFGCNPSV